MNKIMKVFLSAVCCVVSFYSVSLAVMANPKSAEISQPDGSKIKIFLKGDEFYSWNEDDSGYTIVKDDKTKYWTYARQTGDGSLETSEYIVGKNSPAVFAKSLKDEKKLNSARQKAGALYNKIMSSRFSAASSGQSNSNFIKAPSLTSVQTKTNLVLLVQFKDVKFSTYTPFKNLTETDIRSSYNNLFNQAGYSLDGAKGSVYDFFNEVSYGKINMHSVITPIVTLDNNYVYYYQNNMEHVQDMITEALAKLKLAGFNFKEVWPDSDVPDNFTVVHAGGGAEYASNAGIWSHMGFIPDTKIDGITFSRYHTVPARRGYDSFPATHGITVIGVICHESMHFFGVPDLYDYTYTSAGLGGFCLMAGGVWNTWNGPDGNMPAHPSAWIKYILGWNSPKTPAGGINAIATSASSSDGFYILTSPNFSSYEYFLVENRQAVGFDYALPEQNAKRGLLIYHVDESRFDFYDPQNPKKNNNDRTHYLVALEEAGAGTWDWTSYPLANSAAYSGSTTDYFRADTVSTFQDSNTLSPDSRSYYTNSSGVRINSGIEIFEISDSASVMYFTISDYGTFVDSLSDTGLSFVNKIMKYQSGTTRTALKEKLSSETEKIKLQKYFVPTVQGAYDAGTMGTVYADYQNGSVLGISNSSMGLLSAANANLIIKLNYNLTQTSQTYTTVGNITKENNNPAVSETEQMTGSSNKRFTGTGALLTMQAMLQNYGYLIPNISTMKTSLSYEPEAVYETTDVSSKKGFTYFPGVKSKVFTDLANVVYYPNPVRNSKLSLINLPDQQSLSIQFFTVSGQLIKKYSINDTKLMGSGSRLFEWDCKNNSGNDVAQGVYFLMIRTESDKLIKKIAVIR